MTSDRFQRRLERLLDQIEESVDQRDWQKVVQFTEDVLVLDPDNSDAKRFLAAAGRALGVTPDSVPTPIAETTPSELPTPAATAPEAERRQLTVMFCDLQGSKALPAIRP